MEEDRRLIDELMTVMDQAKIDFTSSFRLLSSFNASSDENGKMAELIIKS